MASRLGGSKKEQRAFVSVVHSLQKGGMDLKLSASLRPVDLIVFDCDGVLLDTMSAKIEAFRSWVPEAHAALRGAFMDYIMGSFGRSRTYHVEYFYRELLGASPDQSFLDAEVARFTEICEPLCAAAPWKAGSKEFVKACLKAEALRYVLSGTPQKPLEEMLASTNAAGLFDVIIGSPPGKPESMERILKETGVAAERAVFIGDANADQEAALHVGAHFVYIPSEAERPMAPIETEVNDLRELLPVRRG